MKLTYMKQVRTIHTLHHPEVAPWALYFLGVLDGFLAQVDYALSVSGGVEDVVNGLTRNHQVE